MPIKKSRSGCANCKQKKIKCDETKPACQRCTRLNQKCLGYNQGLKWSDKHEVFKTKSRFNAKSKDTPGAVNNDSLYTNPDDRRVELSEQVTASVNDFQHYEHCFDDLLAPADEMFQLDDSAPYSDPFFSSTPLINIEGLASLAEVDMSHRSRPNTIRDQDTSSSGDLTRQCQPATIGTPRSVMHHDTLLVEYYFKAVATLYSCFDGNMNPFRTTIGKTWDSSFVTKLTMQSMAAACLSRDFPNLAPEGKTLRFQALDQINEEIQGDSLSDASFLCLIMLGQSASWHHAADLGLQQYKDARKILDDGHAYISGYSSEFFSQALDYWRMILSFVSDSDDRPTDTSSKDDDITFQALPHPWALCAPEMMATISKVGKLILNHRRKFRNRGFWKQAQILELQQMMSSCRLLELRLLNQSLPSEVEIVDPGDKHTPISHLIKIAEVYRFVALIQLYRVFPDVLLDRVLSSGYDDTFGNITALSGFGVSATEDDAQLWLRKLVLHIVQILSSIPFESHTRSIQAFLYVSLSSELRKSPNGVIDEDTLQIIQARHLIQSRLEAYRFVFAPEPAQRKLDLVLKVWEEMDIFDKPVFWVDVMLDNNLEVVFC